MNRQTEIVRNTLMWIWNTDWATFAEVVFDVDVNTAPDHKLEYLKKFNEARIENPANLFALLDYKKMDKITQAAVDKYGSGVDDLLEKIKRLQTDSNVLKHLMGSLDSRDESDWLLLEEIDRLMKQEGIPRWSEEE